MAPDKNKIAKDCFARGSAAMAQQNWDYAIEMFGQCAMLVPDNVVFRQSLRGCEEKKYNGNKKGARMAGIKLAGIKSRIGMARKKADWEALDRAAEEGLTVNPWDPQLNADMAKACEERGFRECAVWGYRQAATLDPKSKEFMRSLALALEAKANYLDAIKCWERLLQLNPLDSEARSKINQLEARSAMQKGGYEAAESTQELRTGYDFDTKSKQDGPRPADGPGMSVEADLQRAIRKEPANKDNYLKLADYYRRQKQLEPALEQYQKALEVSGGDFNIREQAEDVELEIMRNNLALAKTAAGESPDDEVAKENSVALAKELIKREIDVFSRRMARNTTNMGLKFELAKRYMRIGKIDLAIPLLQQAGSDTRIQNEVLVALGKCFHATGQKDLALRQFDKAIPNINPQDKSELLVEAHYLAGRLCEELKKRDIAENHFGEVIAIDYTYKDARRRLERLQKGEGEGE
jgi:tetratricopeptide (TPR) repeat protein